jgi:hypothetical protein
VLIAEAETPEAAKIVGAPERPLQIEGHALTLVGV